MSVYSPLTIIHINAIIRLLYANMGDMFNYHNQHTTILMAVLYRLYETYIYIVDNILFVHL